MAASSKAMTTAAAFFFDDHARGVEAGSGTEAGSPSDTEGSDQTLSGLCAGRRSTRS